MQASVPDPRIANPSGATYAWPRILADGVRIGVSVGGSGQDAVNGLDCT